MMEENESVRESTLKEIMDGFIESYMQRDTNVEFSEWLGERIRQEMPDMTEEESRGLAQQLVGAVAEYDRTLGDLNKAIEGGDSKEEWLAERLAEECSGMPMDTAGTKLQRLDGELMETDGQLICELGEAWQHAEGTEETGIVEWNEYSIKDKIHGIGKKAVMAGLGVAANALRHKVEEGEDIGIRDAVGMAFDDGVQTDSAEIKATVAGAVKVVAEKGLEKRLPADISAEAIGNMAGVAVEGAEALYDAVNGETTMTNALDRIARAGVAGACNLGRDMLKGYLEGVPFVGPLLVDLLGGLLDHMESEKFQNNVYTLVRDAAVATWEGIKESGRRIMNHVTNSMQKLLG